MIEYTLPDFTDGMAINRLFLDIQRERPDMLEPDVRIGSVFGNFPGCVLNGGRAQLAARPWTPAEMEERLCELDTYGVQARLTLTNMFATEEHLADPYVQEILGLAAAHGAAAIVANDAVDAYMAREFPGMARILSTTYEILDVETFNEACRTHDLVVLNYTKHRDEEFLHGIERPERCEVMVNEYCRADCPKRMEHYRHISADQLAGTITDFACTQPRTQELFDRILGHAPGDPVMLTNDDVRRMHDDLGIRNFKLVGRGMPPQVVADALSYYLIRPEYRDAVKQQALLGVQILRGA